jgi:hypothetical protein
VLRVLAMATFSPPVDAGALDRIPSVPESEITEELASRLPRAVPAPWKTSGSGLVWLHRATPGADAHHQRGLTFARSIPLTMGAFLRYDEGSSGPYDEILAAPTFVYRNRHVSFPVPFIAVDSEASVAGGRENWAIPKTLAEFDWRTSDGRPDRLAATGEGWSVQAHVRWAGPRMLLYSRGSQVQVRADGEVVTVPVRSRGIGRLARVEVSSDGPSISSWLRSGVHMGVAVESAKHTILPAFPDPLA